MENEGESRKVRVEEGSRKSDKEGERYKERKRRRGEVERGKRGLGGGGREIERG